jgi:dienelactone hydrolase
VPPLWVGAEQVRHHELPAGVLSVPVHGARNLPAVLLLVDNASSAGAEEAGPVRPFTELRTGLASRGVATWSLAPRGSDDVIAAVAALAARAEVDARRVVVIAHGATAQLLPEVLSHSAHVAGVGVLASSTGPGDVVAHLAGQPRPVLVVHAGHDAAVTFADLDRWKQGLVLKGNARFRVFPALNHELRAVRDDGVDPHIDVNVVELWADWAQQR